MERIVPSVVRIRVSRISSSYAPTTTSHPSRLPRDAGEDKEVPRRDASITRPEGGADRSVHGLVREDRRRPRTQ